MFVDDLDRCRPDYAISVLECIKHLFSVQGLVFVLSIDDTQLNQAIKAVYGPLIDSDGYLRRFIDWKFRLPKPTVFQFVDFMFHSSELYKIFSQEHGVPAQSAPEFVRVLSEVSNSIGFSLRKIEQIFTEVNLTLRSIDKKEIVLADRFALFACLRHVPSAQYFENIENSSKLAEYMGQYLNSLQLRTHDGKLVRAFRVVHHWFFSIEKFDSVTKRDGEISRRLDQIFEIRSQTRHADGTLRQEILDLEAESAEIHLVRQTLQRGKALENISNRTFVEFFNRRLDATEYIFATKIERTV